MTTTRTSLRGRAALLALPSLIAFAMSAQAQQKPKAAASDDDALAEVVVTGSRIARPELDRLEPTVTVDSKTLDNKGYLDVGAALSDLPGFGVQPVSANNTQSAFGIAQSFVDLYSLGSQRTLVLVNGHRFVSGNTASLNGPTAPGEQVNLNDIPTKLIDHIETVSVGGAPIYGSDAISGTVNIILKRNFQGLDVDVQGGISDKTDAAQYRLRALGGHNFIDDKLNVIVSAEFLKTHGLIGTARPVYASDLSFVTPLPKDPTYKTVLASGLSVAGINYGGVPLVDDIFLSPGIGLTGAAVGVTDSAGNTLAWGNTPYLQPYNAGTPTSNAVFGLNGDGERLSQVSNLLSPTERMNFDTLMNLEITDHIKAYGEAWFTETHATNLIAQPAYNTWFFGGAGSPNGNFVVNVNNPFLSANDRTLIQNALNAYQASGNCCDDPNWSPNQFYVSRASTDLQSGRATATEVLARGVAGIQGDFTLLNRSFNWDASINYGRVDSNSTSPQFIWQNLQNALNAVVDPTTGQIVCTPGYVNAPTSSVSSTCAPLNIFGHGSPTQAAVQYITHLAEAKSLNSQRDFNANFGGDIITLFGNTWKANVGFENRRESASFKPDNFYTQQLGQASVTAIEGSYLNNETYGEVLLPFIQPNNDIPGLYRFEMEGAARHVINSLSGGATTYTEGLKWMPTQDVLLRANKTKSIRAPAVTELFLPTATSFQFANDPCDHNFYQQGTDPATRLKNCQAAGIDPATFNSNAVNASAQGTTSGNPNLVPETANAKTFGIVLTPRWIPRLTASADYIYIRLTNAISSLQLTDILDACYDSPNYPNDATCHLFTRNAQGQITNFKAGYVNAGLLEFGGWTGQLQYGFDLPGAMGGFGVRVNWFDMQQLNQKVGSAAEVSEAGTLSAFGGAQATPKHRGIVDLDYHVWQLDWDTQGLYTGAVKFSNTDGPTDKNIEVVHGWWIINSTMTYTPIDRLQVRLIVDNVFNKQPPFPSMAGVQANFAASTSLYFQGIMGRYYTLGADYKF